MNNDLRVDELLTDEEVRSLLAVSRTTLWRLRKEEGFPFGRAGRKYLYRKSEVLQWIKDNRHRAVQIRLDL
jgi:excisionase family DNA binding protein